MKRTLTLSLLLFAIIAFAQREEKKIPATHTGAITSAAVNFDGSRALTGGTDARANLWNTATGAKIKGFGAQEKEITDVKFNSDESLFATSSRNMSIVVWDGATQKPKKIMKETAEVLALDFYPFNNNLISVDAAGAVKLWDANGGKVLNENYLPIDEKNVNTASVQFSHDGKHIGVHVNSKLLLYNYSDLKLLGTYPAAVNKISKQSFDLSPDGKWLVFKNTSDEMVLVSCETGTVSQTLTGDFKHESFVGFANNSQLLFLGTDNGKVQIYNLAAKRVIKEFTAHEGVAVDGGLSLNGKVLVTTGTDLSLKRWDVSDFAFNFCQEPDACSHNVAISSLMTNDENQNGLLDAGEKATMNITVKNSDADVLYDVIIKLTPSSTLEGLELPAEVFAGNILGGTSKTITVPIVTNAKLTQGSTSVTVDVTCMGAKMSSKNITLQAGSSANAGVAVKSFQFFSPSGKAAKGEPITVLVTLENITRVMAENVTLSFKLPLGVSAIDKVKETLPKIAPGEKVNVSIQVSTNADFKADTIVLGLELTGVSYTNAADVRLALPVNKQIYTTGDLLAMVEKGSGAKTTTAQAMDFGDGVAIEKIRYVVLTIGINSYEGSWPKLGNAVNDAKATAEELQKSYGFTVNRSLYDKQATRENIIKEFEWLVDNLNEGDNLLIFYSGHGEFKEALNKGFWVPVDAVTNSTSNLISNADIQTFLASIPAKHTLLISDACFSGDIFRGAENVSKESNDKYYQRANSLVSREAITSGGIEPVMDGGKDGHSIFTYYMLKALRENQSKFVDAGQLFEAIKIPIVNNSDQAPKFSHIKNTGDEGGEFIFYKKTVK